MAERHIVMLGTDPSTMGGVAAVVNVYRESGLFERWPIKYLSTHQDGSATPKLLMALAAWFQFLSLIIARHVDLVHIHTASRASFWRKLMFVLPAVVFRIPIVLHLHGGEFNMFYEQECGPIAKRLIRFAFDRARYVIVLSEKWKNWVSRITQNAHIRVIHNPVRCSPTPSLGHQREPATLLCLGRLGKGKGTYDLLEAASQLAPEFTELKLLLGGNGEIEAAREQARQAGIIEHVQMLGWVTGAEKEYVLTRATVYVLPSYNEGLPMSVLEAMAVGLPIVSTPVGGIPEAVTDGIEGFLVTPGDIPALTARLRELLMDGTLCQQMGHAAREKVSTAFSDQHIVPQIEAIYTNILRDK